MKRGRLKTIVLILLILNCFFLTYQIWFKDNIHGYKFSVLSEDNPIILKLNSLFGKNKKNSVQGDYKNMFLPMRMVVNRGGANREIYDMSNSSYPVLYSNCGEYLKQFFQSVNLTYITITDEQWEELARSRSVLVDFDSGLSSSIIGQLYEVPESQIYEQLQKIREIILLPGDNITKEISIAVKDYQSGISYRYFLPTDKSGLEELIEQYAPADKNKQTALSYDQKYHNQQIFEKVFISPFVYIGDDTPNGYELKALNPLLVKDEDTLDIYKIRDNIIKCFDYNTNTIQKYRDKNEAIVFVDTYSTLKVNQNGVLEYTATDEKRGLKLTSSGVSNTESAVQLYRLIEEIYQSIGLNVPEFKMMNDLDKNPSESQEFHFDRLQNGFLITTNINGTDGNKLLQHFAEATVKNGRLISFKINIKQYEWTDVSQNGIPVMDAISMFANNSLEEEELWIDGVYWGYEDNGVLEQLPLCWNLKTGGSYRATKR